MATAFDQQQRIQALNFDYFQQPKRALTSCNLCGGVQFTIITHRDRYGFPAQAHACTRCGLIFLNPVMTTAAYGRFYCDIYRPLVSAYHGRLINADTIQTEQQDYAFERAELLVPYIKSNYRTLLDIGGSTGVVAHAWAKRFNLQASILDPAPLELAKAHALGLTTISGLLEDYNPNKTLYDLVALCQTVDHLLDVTGAMHKIKHLLAPNGLFFVDIVDFRAAYLRNRSVEAATKIDHPYYLTESTMEGYLARAGFSILRKDYAGDHLHISYLCCLGQPDPFFCPPSEDVKTILREIRQTQSRTS